MIRNTIRDLILYFSIFGLVFAFYVNKSLSEPAAPAKQIGTGVCRLNLVLQFVGASYRCTLSVDGASEVLNGWCSGCVLLLYLIVVA